MCIRDSIQLYVLPELSPVGYSQTSSENLHVLAETDQPGALSCQDAFSALAIEIGAFVCYGVPHRCGDQFFIRHIALNSSGVEVGHYDKSHLCDFGNGSESTTYQPGRGTCVFECFGWRVGMLICADIRYPELARELCVGRGVICCCSQ
eukprot:TRINITY_DN15034_c0_g1_i1.p1 TRINITY_DN15034_c0_g1~~TRINITY_DN15034_c0_g1_i1.p1  ORF type:complete len:175 (+),score=20.15 TRINITY_DN15034_c0_g1_i1:81-527(+)